MCGLMLKKATNWC